MTIEEKDDNDDDDDERDRQTHTQADATQRFTTPHSQGWNISVGRRLSLGLCRSAGRYLAVADLIGRVANDETPPFRPQLPPSVNTQDHQRLVQLLYNTDH